MLVRRLMLGVVALSVVVLPLRPTTGMLSVDVSSAWPTPTLVFEPCPNDGPVLITVRYQVPSERLNEFVEAMRAVRPITAAHGWPQFAALSQCRTIGHAPREVHRGVVD